MMETQSPGIPAAPNRLSPRRRKAEAFGRRMMNRYASVLLPLAAFAVTAVIVALFWYIPHYQQEFSGEAPTVQTPVIMLNPQRLSAEQQKKLNWILQTQNPALLTRGDHPHSYTAMWKRQKQPSAVSAPETGKPVFSKAAPAPLPPLSGEIPEKDKLRRFVPVPVQPPVAVKHSLPRAFDEKGRLISQLRIEPVNKPVTAPTRLTLRKQGPLMLPHVLESCGAADLDELAKQQVVSAMPRLGEIREITIYWNRKEDVQ